MNGFVSMSSGIGLGLSSKPISSLSSRCVPIPSIGRDFCVPPKLSADSFHSTVLELQGPGG